MDSILVVVLLRVGKQPVGFDKGAGPLAADLLQPRLYGQTNRPSFAPPLLGEIPGDKGQGGIFANLPHRAHKAAQVVGVNLPRHTVVDISLPLMPEQGDHTVFRIEGERGFHHLHHTQKKITLSVPAVVTETGAPLRRAEDEQPPTLFQPAISDVRPRKSKRIVALYGVQVNLLDRRNDHKPAGQIKDAVVVLKRAGRVAEATAVAVGLPGLDQNVKFIFPKIMQHKMTPSKYSDAARETRQQIICPGARFCTFMKNSVAADGSYSAKQRCIKNEISMPPPRHASA